MDIAFSTHSSLREKTLEYVFLGDLLKSLWQAGRYDVEIMKAEIDNAGYDLVIDCGGFSRHIQLKSTYEQGSSRVVTVNTRLSRKPSGCVIWMFFDPETLALGPFLWFGDRPGHPLPSLGNSVPKHSRGDANGIKHKRLHQRKLGKAQFESLSNMSDVVTKLFG